MKNGKVRHYSSKRAYEDSLKGMFANRDTKKNHSRKIQKVKNKSKKRIKHRGGVGKVSSTRKKFCDTCKREGQSFEEGKCKVCVKAFKEYKQPQATPEIREELRDLQRSYVSPFTEEELISIQNLMDKINDTEYTNYRDLEEHMDKINDIMKGYGVEGLSEERGGERVDLMYVNMGDTYAKTVIFDYDEGLARIGDWGSYVEELPDDEEEEY
jgi:molybdenum cofactor biosynthesis enzyme MoaA